MLGIQKEYLDYMGEVKDRLKDVESLANSLDSTIDDLKFTEMLVPVVGAFSSGKSTLINSFLGDEYLPVGITPETSLATEIRFSEKNEIEAIRADNTVDRYDMNKEDMKKIKNNARNYKHIRVFLNNE